MQIKIKKCITCGYRTQLVSKVSRAGFYLIKVFSEMYLDHFLTMKRKFNFCYQHSSLITYFVYSTHAPKAIILEEIFSFDYAGVFILF